MTKRRETCKMIAKGLLSTYIQLGRIKRERKRVQLRRKNQRKANNKEQFSEAEHKAQDKVTPDKHIHLQIQTLRKVKVLYLGLRLIQTKQSHQMKQNQAE